MSGIEDVLHTLGFTTAETEPLAKVVYAKSGEASLVFTSGLVNGYVQEQLTSPENKISEAELKRIILRTVLASSFAGFAAALIEADIPVDSLQEVFEVVTKFVQHAKTERASKKQTMN